MECTWCHQQFSDKIALVAHLLKNHVHEPDYLIAHKIKVFRMQQKFNYAWIGFFSSTAFFFSFFFQDYWYIAVAYLILALAIIIGTIRTQKEIKKLIVEQVKLRLTA